MTAELQTGSRRNATWFNLLLAFLATAAFSAAFLWVNQLNYNWLSPLFELRSSQTTWGLLQRLYLIVPLVAISFWRPRQVGFVIGRTFRYRKMLLWMLALNMAVIAGYRLLAGGTPYTGWDLLFNEIITVPLVEEVMWRGVVFAVLASVLGRGLPESQAATWAGVISGICFGLLHAGNALSGYALSFVILQTLNATVWGVAYGIARARTGSLYSSILLHAAMNLIVVI